MSSMYVKGSSAFPLERSALSTMPYVIDDPPKSKSGSLLDIKDLLVDLYNGCKTANLRIATNFELSRDDRCLSKL